MSNTRSPSSWENCWTIFQMLMPFYPPPAAFVKVQISLREVHIWSSSAAWQKVKQVTLKFLLKVRRELLNRICDLWIMVPNLQGTLHIHWLTTITRGAQHTHYHCILYECLYFSQVLTAFLSSRTWLELSRFQSNSKLLSREYDAIPTKWS